MDAAISSMFDWSSSSLTVTKLSDRTFLLSGRPYTSIDFIRVWQAIGSDGHIFIYDYEADDETYRQKRPKGRKRDIARDADLDSLTVSKLTEIQESLGET